MRRTRVGSWSRFTTKSRPKARIRRADLRLDRTASGYRTTEGDIAAQGVIVQQEEEVKSLPDYIRPGLDVVLVGINPGLRSAELGHHFAGVNNRFWDLLHASGMTPRRLTYEEDSRLTEFGIGLTNIAGRPTRSSSELSQKEFAKGRRELADKLDRHTPMWVVFVGITVYREFRPELRRAKLRCGRQKDAVGEAGVFVVPNPSGRNAHYTYKEMLRYWKKLAVLMERDSSRRSTNRKLRR